jgi:hypothetical protein
MAYRMLVVGDGYAIADLPQFRTDVAQIANVIQGQPWVRSAPGFALYSAEVISSGSGIPGDSPAPASPGPFFGGRYAGRLLAGTDQTVRDTKRQIERAHDVRFAAVAVMTHSVLYGGSSYEHAWFAGGDDRAAYLAIHEIGHICELADEYGSHGKLAKAPAYLPVNIDSQYTPPKWSASITPGVSLPSEDCAGNSAPGTGPNIVGAFEGGNHYQCGAYRAQQNCLMRDVLTMQSMCAVCQAQMAFHLR